jgi:drug/metabolite transporter (DMT)-like permease
MVAKLSSGFVGMMVSLVPLLTILASVPLLKKRPTPRQLVGVLVGLVCMGVLMADKLERDASILALLLATTVPLAYAIGNTWNKRRFSAADPLALACVAMLGGAVLLVPLSIATEEIRMNDQFVLATGAILILGILGTGIAMALFYWLIQKHGPLFAGMVTYLIPIGAVILGWLDQESVSPVQIAALAGILITVGVTQYGATHPMEEAPVPEV